jgi:hypothetical protein
MALERIHVRPAAPDALIFNPDAQAFLPPDGAEVPRDAHWLRLEMRGDVVIGASPAPALPAAPPDSPLTPAPAARRPDHGHRLRPRRF